MLAQKVRGPEDIALGVQRSGQRRSEKRVENRFGGCELWKSKDL